MSQHKGAKGGNPNSKPANIAKVPTWDTLRGWFYPKILQQEVKS